MMAKTSLEFKHPSTGAPIVLFTNQIFGAMWLEANKTVAIIGPGGAMVPVAGSMDEVTKRLTSAMVPEIVTTNPKRKGKTDK